MAGKESDSGAVLKKLDRVIDLLEDLLVLQGRRAGMGKEELRKVIRIDSKRVSRITKHVQSLEELAAGLSKKK